jgi:hypothetical protein
LNLVLPRKRKKNGSLVLLIYPGPGVKEYRQIIRTHPHLGAAWPLDELGFDPRLKGGRHFRSKLQRVPRATSPSFKSRPHPITQIQTREPPGLTGVQHLFADVLMDIHLLFNNE